MNTKSNNVINLFLNALVILMTRMKLTNPLLWFRYLNYNSVGVISTGGSMVGHTGSNMDCMNSIRSVAR